MDVVERDSLHDVVEYVGPQYGASKYGWFYRADIFAFPTNYQNEAFPLVLLEALSTGCPVVTANVGGIPEIIKDGTNGYLVAPENAKELAQKLAILIANPELRSRMAKRGRHDYEKKYTLEKFEEHFCRIIDTVVRKEP